MLKGNKGFKFFVPFSEIEKATDENGNETMIVEGIASTSDKDTDGEYLDPKGFDLSYFNSQGYINWHHRTKQDPEAIIGEPISSKIKPEGLYIKASLYSDSEMAKKVYKLANVLKRNSKNRKLGFSIEGNAIERDELNDNIVKKARITGCAITYAPKNASTFLDVVKALNSGDDSDECWNDLEKGEMTKKDIVEEHKRLAGVLKSPSKEDDKKEANIQEKELNELLNKAEFGDYPESAKAAAKKVLKWKSDYPDEVKGMTSVGWKRAEQLAAGKMLSKKDIADIAKFARHEKNSSVDPKFKDSPWKDNGHVAWLGWGGKSMINWAKTKMNEIKKTLDTESGSALRKESLDSDIKEQNNSLSKSEVYIEIFNSFSGIDVDDANEIFDLIKTVSDMKKTGINKETIEKAKELLNLVGTADENQDLTKGEESEEDDEEEETEEEDDIQMIKSKMDRMYKGYTALKKAYDSKMSANKKIEKANGSGNINQNEGLQEFMKAQTEIMEKLATRIESIEQTGKEPKSITANAFKQRFEKAMNSEDDSKKRIRLSQRQEVINLLDEATFEKGFDNEFANALSIFESTGQLSPKVISRLTKEKGVLISN